LCSWVYTLGNSVDNFGRLITMNKYEKFHDRVIEEIRSGEKKHRSRAIRAFCLECMGYYAKEVRECASKNCPLYHFRMGRYTED